MVEALAFHPAKDRDRDESFAGSGVGGKATALTARVQEDAFVFGGPVGEGFSLAVFLPRCVDKVGRACSGAELFAGGIVGREEARGGLFR